MHNAQYLYQRSQNSREWLPGYRKVQPKTVFILKPRELTASLDEIERHGYREVDATFIFNKSDSYPSINNAPEIRNLGLPRTERYGYDHLNTLELPRCRRRAVDIRKSQHRQLPNQQINDYNTPPADPNKAHSEDLRNKEQIVYRLPPYPNNNSDNLNCKERVVYRIPKCPNGAHVDYRRSEEQISKVCPTCQNKVNPECIRFKEKGTITEHQSITEPPRPVSNERSRTVVLEGISLCNKSNERADHDPRTKFFNRKTKVILCPGEKYVPYYPYAPVNKKAGTLTRQMESRYLTEVEHRICNAINIFVYKNGVENQPPVLIHIAPNKKSTMESIMTVIQERVRFPIGYPKFLYTLEGTKLMYAYQLKNDGEYVVASNLHKRFQSLGYGRVRTPLMMLSNKSKHIRNLAHKHEEDERTSFKNESLIHDMDPELKFT